MTSRITQDAIRNQVLRSLSVADFALLQPALERGSDAQGVVMEAPDEAITHVYVPRE